MRLSFIFPVFLWLLLLLPPLWALTLLAPRRLARARFWLSLALRTAALLGLILALAGGGGAGGAGGRVAGIPAQRDRLFAPALAGAAGYGVMPLPSRRR